MTTLNNNSDGTGAYSTLTPHPHNSLQSNNNKTLIKGIAGTVLAALIMFAIVVSFSLHSQPTESLYSFKTKVAERFIRQTKLTAESRAAYDTSLLQTRLDELNKFVTDTGTTSPEVIQKIAALSHDHVTDVMTTLATHPSLSDETRITTIARVSNIVRAEETLSDTLPEFAPMSDQNQTTDDSIRTALRSAIVDFVTTNATDTIQSFLGQQINVVSTDIVKVAAGSSAQQSVIKRISETQDALLDGKFADAIYAILRAEQAIMIDGYLFDSERGPVDGVPIEPGPVPEGN